MLKQVSYLLLVLILYCNCGQNNKKENEKPTRVSSKDSTTAALPMHIILFFGNSLTAGYGVDPTEAFPAIIQKKIDSLKLDYKVINAGVSGETTSGGLSRIDWILRQKPELFVLELGGNDGLRGIPLKETKKNLQSIIDRVKEKSPSTKIILAGMMIPPNMGSQYTKEFQSIYPDLATSNKIALIPFLLQNVGGIANLNQADGIHPTAEGHRIVAENVWVVVKVMVE
jgi:acyl-CoA thioesterase-1